MFKKKKDLDNLSLEELERLVKIKQREARQERFLRLSKEGASTNSALIKANTISEPISAQAPPKASNAGLMQTPQVYSLKDNKKTAANHGESVSKKPTWKDRVLTLVEVSALLGLLAVLAVSYLNLQELNQEVVQARDMNRVVPTAVTETLPTTEAPQAEAMFSRLPGGHTSPTSDGGAMPDIPTHLQTWVQPAPPKPIPVPEQRVPVATRIVIPSLNVDAPIIQGVSWEDLKKGVGQLPGSARPGERGNLYLAAHNDIFGEIFRYLEKLEPGDEYYIYAGEAKYTYLVREKRIIEPTEVSVMLPTTEPVSTLQTCYPYLIDTHRLVVVGDLVE